MAVVQPAPDSSISEVICTNLDYAQYSCAPKRGVSMASDTSLIAEQGVATLPDAAWAQARQRAEFIGPLAAIDVVGHEAADAAAHALGLSRRQVYVLIRRARCPARLGACDGLGSQPIRRRKRQGTPAGIGRAHHPRAAAKALPDQAEA